MQKIIKFLVLVWMAGTGDFVFAIYVPKIEEPFWIRKMNAYTECSREMNVNEDVALALYKDVHPMTLIENCFLECAYSKIGWVDENKTLVFTKIDSDVADFILSKHLFSHTTIEVEKAVRKNMKKCYIDSLKNNQIDVTNCNVGQSIRSYVNENILYSALSWTPIMRLLKKAFKIVNHIDLNAFISSW